jgi:hypothetical protein
VRQVNEPFIRQVVAVIERNADRWNQSGYRLTGECGDTFCLAGWTCHIAGLDVYQLGRHDRGPRAIFWRAANLLGLNRRQAAELFFWADKARCHPTVEELKTKITATTGVAFE